MKALSVRVHTPNASAFPFDAERIALRACKADAAERAQQAATSRHV
jgi:hypothetical protein